MTKLVQRAGQLSHRISDGLHLLAHRWIADPEWRARNGEPAEQATFDFRLRSLDREPDEPDYSCGDGVCPAAAQWSVWLHTPDWGPDAGLTTVLCTAHAIRRIDLAVEAALKAGVRRG